MTRSASILALGRRLLLGVLASCLWACGEKPPLQVGFIGGLTGRFSDLGVAGRNAAQMAVDEVNEKGGIAGRKVVLLAEDDTQEPGVAAEALRKLLARRVEAVLGPMTSAMAMAIVPQTNAAQVVLISPTVTTTELSGKDDWFFRVIPDVGAFAQSTAQTLRNHRQLGSVALVLDLANASYVQSWARQFEKTFTAQGGKVLRTVTYQSMQQRHYQDLATQALQDKPQGVVLVCNSVDAAMLGQQLRRMDPAVALAGSDWTATARLIEQGGRAVEGMIVSQVHNPSSTAPDYLRFVQAYRARFGEEPGFAGAQSYDAARVLLDALGRRKEGASLKAALLAQPRYAVLQGHIVFDAWGDASRPAYQTIIRNGRFEPYP